MRTSSLLFILLFSVSCSANPKKNEPSDKEQWRLYKPTIPKGAPKSYACLNENQDSFEVKGDFNKNGKTDVARLEENSKIGKRRVAVYFDGKNVPHISEEKAARYSGNYLRPGKKKNTLSYGSCESSEVILTWDAKKQKFTENWVSD